MNLKQLEYFIKVAELGSFTKASLVLDMTQPALSRQIRHLEAELKTQLLIRNGRGAELTEEGKRLLMHGHGIIRQVSIAEHEINSMSGRIAGRAAIGLTRSIAAYFTPPLVEAFQTEMPDVELSVISNRSVILQEWLVSGRLDVAVMYDTKSSTGINLTPITEERYAFVQPAEISDISPLPLREVSRYPLIIHSQPNTARMMIDMEMSRIGQQIDIRMEIDSKKAILDLVRAGYGSAILSERTISELANPVDYCIREIFAPVLKRTISLAVPDRTMSRVQAATISMLNTVSKQVYPGARVPQHPR